MPVWKQTEYEAYLRRFRGERYGIEPFPAGQASSAKPQCAIRNESVATSPGKDRYSTRRIIRIESRRRRLIDPDNLCPKYVVDALRYAGAIPDDTAAHVEIQISQVKVATRDEEGTLIEIV